MNKVFLKMLRPQKIDTVDVAGIAGAACLVRGAEQVYHPAGWIAAGVLLLAVFLLAGAAQKRRERQERGS